MTELPTAIAAYVEAANIQDAARVAACFTPAGTVRDEGSVRRGREEIAAWAADTAQRYGSLIAPRSIGVTDGRHTLRAEVTGNFPGSPVTLSFNFRLRPEGIDTLEVSA